MTSTARACVALAALAALAAAGPARAAPPKAVSAATEDAHIPSAKAVELHHSLDSPMDQSSVYWTFGGSTVMTSSKLRLTPAAQNRAGWAWNEYPVESEAWEVTMDVEISSKPHFGGDGFALWLLHGNQDPTFQSDPGYLLGDTFGLRNDFRGVGVVFDIYDNDGRRDNPSIFVLYNPEGADTNYNHDNDYADDMYKRVAPGSNSAYSCVANVRNTGSPVKVMVKYLRNILHVYVDTDDGLGLKFCLAVEFDEGSFKDHHVALTAVTGQVADAHDVLHLSTKYLTGTEQEPDDAHMRRASGGGGGSIHGIYWTLVALGGALLLGVSVHEAYTFRVMEAQEIDPMLVCQEINGSLVRHYVGHAALAGLLLVGFQFKALLFSLPLLAWRGFQASKRTLRLNPVELDKDKTQGTGGLSFSGRLYITTATYAAAEVYYLYRWLA